MKYVTFLLACLVVLASSHANASIIIMSTPDPTRMDDQPVDVQATFTTGTDSITVVVNNLQINPTSIIQNLSGLRLTVSTGQTAGTLVSSSGVPRRVAKKGAYTDQASVSTGWELETIGTEIRLHVLGTDAGPSHTLLGLPDELGIYTSANGSIAGNKPHNPFLAERATFVLSVLGVTAASTITEATFEFGTSPGSNVSVPEPAALLLLTLGGIALVWRRRRA
jgi:hypothetical protein